MIAADGEFQASRRLADAARAMAATPGALQLRLLLREARAVGIDRALVTCDEGNIASARVMEKNGGVWQDTIEHWLDGKLRRTKRYWIDTNV